jgi:hypothetical protein
MRSVFIGGTEDGKVRETSGERFYLVPFMPIKPRPVRIRIQRYRQTEFDPDTATATYVFVGIDLR